MSHCQSAAELPTLQALEERARSASADHTRQAARLKSLSADFDRERLTASPQIFSLLQAEIEQQELIEQSALQAQAAAETALANARTAYDRQQAEERKQQRRKALQTELENHQIRITEYSALYASLPEKIELERQAHSFCLRQLADL